MPKLVKVYSDAQLVECPEKWAAHKGIMSECTIYESTTEPGKYWFYLIGDLGDSYTYFQNSMLATCLVLLTRYGNKILSIFDIYLTKKYPMI